MNQVSKPLNFQTSAACKVVKTLQAAGHTAYFAGGCVRDALRGAPIKDIDIATSATPDEVERLFPACSIGVGKAFGVMLVIIDGESFDVATFRCDGGYQDGRHPESITFDTAEHDAQRRDFTANALFYNPITHEMIDYVGGVEDLKKGVLRAVGDPRKRFQEDRLRMLRAIRFAAVCDWEIDPPTWEALCMEAHALGCVSIERIRTEFLRTLCEAKHPKHALERLYESGLLQAFFPELLTLRGCEQDPRFHPEGDVWAHTTDMLELLPAPRDPQLVWAILLHDIAKPQTMVREHRPDGSICIRTPNHAHEGAPIAEAILARFKEPNERIKAVSTAVRYHMQFTEIPKMLGATLRKTLGRPTIGLELELHRLDCLSSHGKLDCYDAAQAALAQFASEPILPPPLITGKELIAYGFQPGPAMGALLKHLYARQLDGATLDTLRAELSQRRIATATPER